MKIRILWGCMLLFPGLSLWAQIDLGNPLKEAVGAALNKSLTIQNKVLEEHKLELDRKGVLNKYIPRVEASASYLYFDSNLTVDLPTQTLPIINYPIFDSKTSLDSYGNALVGSVMAKTILFSGMQIEYGAKAIGQKQKAATHLTEAEKETLIKDVVYSFDQFKLLNQLEKLLQNSQKRLETENKRIEKAISMGLAIPYDRDKIRLAQLDLESKQLELESNRELLYQKIEYLTGYDSEQINAIDYLLTLFEVHEDLSVSEKPELKALEAYQKASEYLVKKEKGSYLPVVGAFGGLSYASLFDTTLITPELPLVSTPFYGRLNQLTLSPNWMVGVSLKWELFGGFERKHKVEQAQIGLQQIKNQTQDTQSKLKMLLTSNKANYQIQMQKYEVSVKQEEIAQNNLNLAVRRYQEGMISISERLEAENDLIKSATQKTQTLIQQRLAALELLATTGKLYQIVK